MNAVAQSDECAHAPHRRTLSWPLSGRRCVGKVLVFYLFALFRSLLLMKSSKSISPPYGCAILEPKRSVSLCLVD